MFRVYAKVQSKNGFMDVIKVINEGTIQGAKEKFIEKVSKDINGKVSVYNVIRIKWGMTNGFWQTKWQNFTLQTRKS